MEVPMTHQHTLWFQKGEDLEVEIHKAVSQNSVCVVIGKGISHTNWFMSETDLNTLIGNLITAKEEYYRL